MVNCRAFGNGSALALSRNSVDGFKIENRKFESTVEVQRTDIEDDRIGVYGPLFEDLGRHTAEFPDELFAELVASGFASECYDGQFFFDTDHPVSEAPGGEVGSASNFTDGAGPAWYLLDLSRAIRPFIYQERIPFTLQRRDQDSDGEIFLSRYLPVWRARLPAMSASASAARLRVEG
ncbi:MAG: Mu-like prophage major head subunit gpT family protein [Sphingomonadaceae bacterium]